MNPFFYMADIANYLENVHKHHGMLMERQLYTVQLKSLSVKIRLSFLDLPRVFCMAAGEKILMFECLDAVGPL
jgi:hypothetical protein